MKAKLYEFEGLMEIRLSNDETLSPNKGESKEDFIERVREMVSLELLDDEFNLIELDETIIATNDTAMLNTALKSASGLQKKMIEHVLSQRKAPAAKKEKAEKKEKASAVSTEEAKASPEFKEAESNIGKYVSFSPAKVSDDEVYVGKIVGVALNKTNTIFYYTVVESNGKRRCCAVLNKTLQFVEAPKEGDVPQTPKAKAKKSTVVKEEAKTVKSRTSKSKAKAQDEDFGADVAEGLGNDLM